MSKAKAFAIKAHGNQNYGARPYAFHLEAVAEILKPFGDTAVAIGYLHDVSEDAGITTDKISEKFGPFVADCVALVTDGPGATREERKAAMHAKLAEVSGDLKIALTVKVADRLANVKACIEDGNKRLLDVYRSEHAAFRQAAYRAGGCDDLWRELDALIEKGA